MRTYSTTAFKPTTRINRHMGILLGFVLISSLCFAGFAYDTSRLADLQSRAKTATYIAVLAIFRNRDMSVQDQNLLVTNIVNIFTNRSGRHTKITRDSKQILVSAQIPYQPVIAQYFGMTPMRAQSMSAGRLSLSPAAVNSELSRIMTKLKGEDYFPTLARLLLQYEQKKMKPPFNRKAINNPGPGYQVKQSNSPNPAETGVNTFANKSPAPLISIRRMQIRQTISASDSSRIVRNPIDERTVETLNSDRPKSQVSFDGKAANRFGELLGRGKSGTKRRANNADIDVNALLENSKDYALETGSQSGFNLMKILVENRNRPANIKKSTFKWSALWKYIRSSYSDKETANESKKSKQFASPSASLYIEFSLLIIVLSNFVLWSLAILKYRMNKKLSREEAEYNRINNLAFN